MWRKLDSDTVEGILILILYCLEPLQIVLYCKYGVIGTFFAKVHTIISQDLMFWILCPSEQNLLSFSGSRNHSSSLAFTIVHCKREHCLDSKEHMYKHKTTWMSSIDKLYLVRHAWVYMSCESEGWAWYQPNMMS